MAEYINSLDSSSILPLAKAPQIIDPMSPDSKKLLNQSQRGKVMVASVDEWIDGIILKCK